MLRSLLTSLLVLVAGRSHAQQYGFIQYTPEEGLAQSQVRCIAQDAQGFMWFGTLGGASRTDGTLFTNLALQEGLPDAQVSAVLCGPDGSVWLGTGGGLVRSHNGLPPQRVALPGPAHHGRIMDLALRTDGSLFIAVDGEGVFRYKEGRSSALEGGAVLGSLQPRVLLSMPDGGLLVGTRNGLMRWSGNKLQSIQVGDTASKSISALAHGPKGSIWVGTFGDGLFQLLDDGSFLEFDETKGLLQDNIRALLTDREGRLWVGTKFGVNLMERGRFRSFTVHQGLPNDNIWCIHQDREGNMWFGTDGAGAIRYTGDRFVTFTQKDGLCSDQVMCIVPDHSGDLWLGTYGNGICRTDGMAMVTTLDGLPNNTVWCGLRSRTGDLWFGTSEGLCRIRGGMVMPLTEAVEDLNERVLSIWEEKSGDLLIGTREGVQRVGTDGSLSGLDVAGWVELRSVRSIVRDGQGRLWLGHDNGLTVEERGAIKHFGPTEGMPSKVVFCLTEDGKGRMWVGTSNGLACVRKGSLTVRRLGKDFGSNYIDLITTDPNGWLWIGTNNGLYHADPDSLLVPDHKPLHITLNDGLRSLECNLNAAHVDPVGRCLFGTAAGLVLHDPSRGPSRAQLSAPTVYITAVRSFLEPTDWSGNCDSLSASNGLPIQPRVGHLRNYLTFDYTAVALAEPNELRFRYRLQGLDEDWLPSTDARFASFSNLPHGEYVFQVMAARAQGPWSSVAELPFRVTPPFWLQGWFFALLLATLSATLFLLLRYRKLRNERREKTRQLVLRSRMLQLEQQALNANMNRHFVFNALNSIQYYINSQDRTMANRYLTSFAKLIRKNLDASQSDTTTLAEEMERLELYLVLEHMRFKDRFEYELITAEDVDPHRVQLPAMMLQPYVENSIWHGILPMQGSGRVVIKVTTADEGHVRVEITDDGIGVETSMARPRSKGDHISRGIEITKGRADVLRNLQVADIRIVGPAQVAGPDGRSIGTKVTIDLPYDRSSDQPVDGLWAGSSGAIFEER